MKVLIVGTAHPFRGGGLSTFNERLAREFQQQKHTVKILNFSLQYPSFLFPGTTQYTDEPAPADIDISSELNSINPINWLLKGIKYRRHHYDLVVIRYWIPFMGPCLGTIARFLSTKHTKVIAIADNIYPHEKRPGDRLFTSYFLKSCDGFVAMSASVLSDITDFVKGKPSKYHKHPLYDTYGPKTSLAEARKKLGIPDSGYYLLFFGFIRHYKGLDIAIEAMADERIKKLPVKLIIAGEYYEDRELNESLITKYDLKDKIVAATDFIPNSEVGNYFNAANLLVQPYRSATQSGVSQTAYHYELPMVVTNVGGLAETVPEGKVGYVTDVTPQAIADAIYDYLTNNKEAQMRANMAEEKKQFSWDTFVKAICATAGY